MDAFNEPYDVTDSTDWLGTPLDCLMPVEQAFRCHVCKDFFNSPMLTSCSHTFCSLCIRRCLAVDGKCPLCRASDQESKLRGNWAMREAVDAFTKSRSSILQFAKAPPPAPSPTSSPKRKAAELHEGPDGSTGSKRPRMSTRSTKARGAEITAAMMRDELDAPESKDSMDSEPEDGLAACPICWTRMKPWQVDKHIDTACPGSPQPQQPSASVSAGNKPTNNFMTARSAAESFSTTTTKAPERLPTLAYSMLKDAALRKKLVELGLSTSGHRQLLEQRHKEWITLWNANCDSARPKKRSELLQDLDIWERTMGGRAPTTSRSATLGAQIKDKDFDGSAWAARHDGSFKDLIANARRTRAKAEQIERAPSATEESTAKEPGKDEPIMISDEEEAETTVLATPPPPELTEPPATVVLVSPRLNVGDIT